MNSLNRLFASRHMGLLLALVLLFVGFAYSSESFRDPLNLLDRTRYWTEIGLVAVPMTLIIATAGIDLSVGSLLALSGIVGAVCYQALGWPLPLALLACVLTGLLGGLLNGVLVSWLKVPSLVATLATLAIFRGLAMGISHGTPVRDLPDAFTEWGALATVGSSLYSPPQQLLILLVVVLLGECLLYKTRFGRWTIQIGENERSARFAGVPVAGMLLGLFMASGLFCGLASIGYIARFATAHPGAGVGFELEVIASVVVGGTRITGGGGSVIGTLFGLCILGLLRFGLDMLGIPQQNQIILIGLLVVIIAIFNEWLAVRQERRPVAVQVNSG